LPPIKTIQFIAGKASSSPSTAAFGVGRVPNSTKAALRDARQYARMIKETATNAAPGPMRDRLAQTVRPVDEWLANLVRLEQSLGKMHAQRNLSRDIGKANYEIEQIRRQILIAQNADEVASLRALMKSKRSHLNALGGVAALPAAGRVENPQNRQRFGRGPRRNVTAGHPGRFQREPLPAPG
jgi:predicted secreted protein